MLSPQAPKVVHGGSGPRLKRGYYSTMDDESNSVLSFFQQRIQTLQSQRETSDTLIKDLMLYCEHIESSLRNENALLTKQVEETRLDLVDSTKSRRDLQKQIERYQQELSRVTTEHESFISRNPYVTVLIDGDGLIFNEHYIKQGIEGGKKAAKELRRAIEEQCHHKYSHGIEVSAKIVANLSGLARALARDGAIDTLTDLKDFTLGFTQAKASFDFVDVGYGKERADSKIRENTRWHLENQNCRQVVLGISHDNGYAPFLDEILRDEATKCRVTILEGVPTVRELLSTGVQVLRLDNDLFRSDKIGAGTVMQERTSPTDSSPRAASANPTPPASTHTSSPFSSYAGMAVKAKPASPPPQLTVPLAPRSANAGTRQKPSQPKWNPGPRGLDKALTVNQAVLESVKKRKDNTKLCNNHFLRGPCAKGDSCQFVHRYKPTEDELAAILHLSRLNPCTMGQDCDADDCIYGHHCPSMRDNTCVHPYCKFPEEAHPPGTKYKNAHIDKNY